MDNYYNEITRHRAYVNKSIDLILLAAQMGQDN